MGCEDHECFGHFACVEVGDPDNGTVVDEGMPQQKILEFRGGNTGAFDLR